MAYERKKKKLNPVRVILVLALIIPLALTIIASTIGRTEFTLPHKLSMEFLGLAQSGLSSSTGVFSKGWSHYIDLVGVRKENEALRQELKETEAKVMEYREAAATNLRLKRLLELSSSFDSPTVTSRIIGRDPSLWFKTLTINKGSSAGIEKGMPAVTVEGVVGQVTATSPKFAKVLLTIDPNSAIDALVQKNRVQGIIKGKGAVYQLHYVLKNHEVLKGDAIVTSGMGGVFPKGLPIGMVSGVENSRRGMFQKIEVTPAVDFRHLEHVTIILKKDPLAD